MPSVQDRFYLYIDKKKSGWIKKQATKAKLSSSAFLTALVEDKIVTDEDFCPSRSFVNLSNSTKVQSAKKK